jgi:hypothetical protein
MYLINASISSQAKHEIFGFENEVADGLERDKD